MLLLPKKESHHGATAALIVILCSHWLVNSFQGGARFRYGHSIKSRTKSVDSTTRPADGETSEPSQLQVMGVVAPLKYKGPYPCLSLCFPNLDSCPTWDFVVDTGANMNTIRQNLVKDYNLSYIKGLQQPTTTAGVGGSFTPGNMVLIGDAALAGLPAEQSNVTFIRNLTAAALPRASPTAGILGSSFCSMFAGGVEFDWYGTNGDPPTFCFYFDNSAANTKGMTRIPIEEIFGLYTVTISINGMETMALLDTGSPITIVSTMAAAKAGIFAMGQDEGNERTTPNITMDHRLLIGGIDGRPMEIVRSSSANISVGVGNCHLGQGPVHIGLIPALSVLESVAGTSRGTPSAILGLDFLRRAYRMIIQPRSLNLFLEELDDTE